MSIDEKKEQNPVSMYQTPNKEDTDIEDCSQCHYQPAKKQEEDCPQCHYTPDKK